MKVCTKCSHNNEDDAKFCVKCGEGLEAQHKAQSQIEIETMQCVNCGYNNKKGVKFCGNCGSSLASDTIKKKRYLWLLVLPVVIIMPFLLLTYWDDIGEAFERDFNLYATLNHSKYISMDGESDIIITLNPKYRLSINDILVREMDICWEAEVSGGLYYIAKNRIMGHHLDYNPNGMIPPIIRIKFIDDKNIAISVDANKGYNRCFTIYIGSMKTGDDTSILFYQKGSMGSILRN